LLASYSLFTGDELNYDLKPSAYMFRCVKLIQEKNLELLLEANDPDAFEVFVRRGGSTSRSS